MADKFKFTHNEKEYEFEKDFSIVRKRKFLRANRRRDELDLAFTIIETIAGEEALEAIDDMDEDEFVEIAKEINKALSATMGE